ncbi:hypothetical protein E2C01_066762 [Portunus trituberculatus]|uniref:Uncharacterized protein n=1 Tax=Portunus trituberculatus TaxID=210409 RepID=A0A5B7HRJ4_PORTR|nr:hypothetical protein [Portunus trituberculatus]
MSGSLRDNCRHPERAAAYYAPLTTREGGRHGTVESCVLWGLRGLQAHEFESCPRSECRSGFLIRGNSFLVGGL